MGQHTCRCFRAASKIQPRFDHSHRAARSSAAPSRAIYLRLSGSITALATPFTAAGDIDFPAWQRLLQAQRDAGTQGVVVAGSTGEAAALFDDEYDALLAVTRRIADSGCNLVDTRLATVGRDVSVTALATGSWDAVAKLETMLAKLEREEGLKLIWYRTGPKPVQSSLLPYVVEVIASDKPGILFQLADFFDQQGITIESLHCSRYRAMQTGADMFSAQLTIGIPADMHIAALRDDFLEFCDHLNLDAIMDPMKY